MPVDFVVSSNLVVHIYVDGDVAVFCVDVVDLLLLHDFTLPLA
jgi:hypothetical protein